MTFTEAAVVVLRQAGRPLHYKKITELAIEKNLLSHVGKTPEVTMSARLAMLAKTPDGSKDVIIKVKPGVFGLKEFSAAVLAAASADGAEGEDIELIMHDIEEHLPSDDREQAEAPVVEDETAKPSALAGAQLFPEEDDDDEPILAGLDEGRQEAKRSGRRRRRRRPGRGGAVGGNGTSQSAAVRDNGGGRAQPLETRDRYDLAGDWQRQAGDDDLIGKSLSDAVFAVLDSMSQRQSWDLEQIAQQLVQRKRLQGEAQALVPTVAAALRADNAFQEREGRRPRFRVHGDLVWLTDWLLPSEALRAERQVQRSAEQQQAAVRKLFLKQVRALPLTGFAELIASWLNAEGVASIRAVRRPGSSANELHFAGVLRQGRSETHLAIVVRRNGQDVDKSFIEQTRGALHHYGQASAAWIITLGMVRSEARQECTLAGVAPCALFDGMEWATALETKGIGLTKTRVELTLPQFELLAALSGTVELETQPAEQESREGRGWSSSGRRRRGRDYRRERNNSDDSVAQEDRAESSDLGTPAFEDNPNEFDDVETNSDDVASSES